MNALYDKPRPRFLNGTFNWPAMNVIVHACSGPYVFDQTEELFAEVQAAGALVRGTSLPLTGLSIMGSGYAASDLAVIPIPASVDDVTFLVMVENVTTPEPYPLIAYIDDAQGLPFRPNGLDQMVLPDWFEHRGWFRA